MRKHYLTHPKFQFSYTFSFIKGTIFSILPPAALIIATLYLMGMDPTVTPEQRAVLYDGINQTVVLFLWCVGIAVALFGAIGVYLSYKYIGPMDRLEAWLAKRLHEADSGEALSLRSGDDLAPIAEILNRMLAKYR